MASFTNVATLSYGGNQVSSNVVTGEIREVLTVSKTAVPAAYAVGDTITYVIYLINSGTAALTGLTVTDDLGGYTFGAGTVYPLRYTDGTVRYFANGVLQAAPNVTAGPPSRRAAPPRSSIRQRSRPTRRPRRTGSSAIP